MLKKFVSLFTVFSVLLCVFTGIDFCVFSEEINACGDNLTWYIDVSTGTLYINGYGDMYDYDTDENSDNAPWYSQRSEISDIVFSDKVTSIGDFAFQKMKISELVVPGNILSIGEGAFYHCSELADVIIEDGVEYIGVDAFSLCLSLKNVKLPSGSNTVIDDFAFRRTAIEEIVFPNGIVSIGAHSFQCDTLVSVLAEGYIESIGSHAFYGLENLKNVRLNGVGKIGYCAFAWSKISSLWLGEGTEHIGQGAFACCPISELVLPRSTKYIGENAFGSTNIRVLFIPQNVEIVDRYAFSKCIYLKTVFIADGVEQIAYGAFENSAVVRIYIPESVTGIDNIFNNTCDATVYGIWGSTAETFAEERKLDFVGTCVIKNSGVGGDVNTDGEVKSDDFITLRRVIMEIPTEFYYFSQTADIDGNGTVDIIDLIKLKKHCSKIML